MVLGAALLANALIILGVGLWDRETWHAVPARIRLETLAEASTAPE